MHEKKTPLIRLAKRDAMPARQVWCIRAGSFVAAILLGGLIFLLIGNNPFTAYATILSGSLGKKTAIRQTVKIAIPLLGTALAIAPCFKMRFWNIGAEGQVLAGGLACATCMICLRDVFPNWLIILCMIVSSIAVGAIWAAIPGFFKARWNTNETLFTLMMNYIATQLVAYFVIVWEVPKGAGKIGIINQSSGIGWLPQIGGYRYLLSIVVVAVLTVLMYIYLNYSKHGYEIAVVGESERTARYVGINVQRVIVRTMLLSGAVCGVAGLLLVGSTEHTLTTTLADGRGFTAVMVSWLAKFNPIFMIFTSFLLVLLNRGASEISTDFGLNQSFADILTGIILFCIIGSEFFINYQIHFRRSAKKEGEAHV